MSKKLHHGIISKIEIIKKTDQLLHKLYEIKSEPLGKGMILEMERKKQDLLKELLVEMINAGISFTKFENAYMQIFTYLKSKDSETYFSKELQNNINQIEEILVT